MSRLALRLTVISALGALWAGDHLTKPARVQPGAPPSALDARPITFLSASGTPLSAWFAPGLPGRGAVLLLHPVRANKSTMAPRAIFLKRLGFALLLFDFQAHGESGGERITFGYREALDVNAAVEKMRELAPDENIGALGVSLGGAALLLSNAHGSLSAIVLESVYPTIEEAISNRLKIFLGPLGSLLSPVLLAQFEPRLGFAPDQLRPVERISALHSPLLLVHGTEDRHTTLREARRLYDAAPEPKQFYALPGAAHVDLHQWGGSFYEEKIGRFLAEHLRRQH